MVDDASFTAHKNFITNPAMIETDVDIPAEFHV